MIVTYHELKDLFHVKDRRCIEKGLYNKVKFINQNNAIVKDPELKELITKFRSEPTLTTDDVCALYNVGESSVINMSRAKIIPCYQLANAKGSQKLFFKSEIEECGTELLLIHSKQTNINFLHYLVRSLSNELVQFDIMTEQDRVIFNMVYTSGYSYGEIAQKTGLTIAKVQQISKKTNLGLMLAVRTFVSMSGTIKHLNKEINLMANKYSVLLNTSTEEVKLKAEKILGDNSHLYHVLNEKLTDTRLSVRAKRCLAGVEILTVGDLISWKEDNLMKLRNLGEKTKNEIVSYVASTGMKFATDIKQYGLLTTEEKSNNNN